MNVPFGSFFSSFFNGGYFLGDLEVNDSCVTVRFLLLRSFRLPIIRAKHWSSEKPNRGYQASFSRQIPQDLSLLFLIKNKKKRRTWPQVFQAVDDDCPRLTVPIFNAWTPKAWEVGKKRGNRPAQKTELTSSGDGLGISSFPSNRATELVYPDKKSTPPKETWRLKTQGDIRSGLIAAK